MFVHSSGRLIGTLMQHDLVDQSQLLVYPLGLGRRQRLLPEGYTATLSLVDARSFGSGVVCWPTNPRREVLAWHSDTVRKVRSCLGASLAIRQFRTEW
ncbi:MAG: hypothetical protein DCC55_16690 [Chloroflexi bacterium]|nr:MAG: hypothetical protein DCC55_16690 [Chloroflexota bacterium]